MRIVVSGATSMIGAALVNQLLARGYEVIAVVRQNCSKLYVLNLSDNLTIVNCDMCDYGSIDTLIEAPIDIAIATAWNGTRGAERNCEKLQKENLRYSIDFLEAMIRLGCKKFFTAGSQAEYGLWTRAEKLVETVETQPNTEYGKYKLKFYEYAKKYCKERSCTLIEPRFFSLYGPNDYAGTLVISTLKKMIKNEPCDLTECIQMWDFLYIDDAIKALCTLIESENAKGIYNFGSGYSVPLKEYIETMMRITQSKSKLHYGAIPYPKTGIVNVNPDVSKLTELGWKANIGFEEGIEEIIDCMREEHEY